ncbi:hypothetical protein [Kitasatospora sp. NPDC058218]|uniref:hypothetical protein n=1 Tax=Kitasatospora sp. NPDC058218 TaxID=3346385 RepID=UPI0036D816B5
MTDTTEAKQNPWLYGQDHPPPPSVPGTVGGTGPWSGAAPAGTPLRVEPDALRQAAGVSRHLQGELRYSVGQVEPDTTAAVQALAGGWGSGAALAQVLAWWKARWTSLDNRLGMTADRLEATAAGYRAADSAAADTFKAQ